MRLQSRFLLKANSRTLNQRIQSTASPLLRSLLAPGHPPPSVGIQLFVRWLHTDKGGKVSVIVHLTLLKTRIEPLTRAGDDDALTRICVHILSAILQDGANSTQTGKE
jgi:hypothetical protein